MSNKDKGNAARGKPAIKGNKADTDRNIRNNVGALVTRPMDGLAQTYKEGMPRLMRLVADTLQQASALAALQAATPEELATLHDYISANLTSEKSALQELAVIVRARSLERTLASAQTTTDTGTKRWLMPNGMVKEARIQKSGLDGKLVEKALLARQLGLPKYMVPTTSWKLKDDTETLLLSDKVFTPDELTALKYKPSYALMPSKPAKEE